MKCVCTDFGLGKISCYLCYKFTSDHVRLSSNIHVHDIHIVFLADEIDIAFTLEKSASSFGCMVKII
jgi:hypothetical protein